MTAPSTGPRLYHPPYFFQANEERAEIYLVTDDVVLPHAGPRASPCIIKGFAEV